MHVAVLLVRVGVLAYGPPVLVAGVLAQAEAPIAVPQLVTWFGAATPFALVLLYWLRREAQRADRWEGLYLALADKTTGEVVPLLVESQRLLAEEGVHVRDLARRPTVDPERLERAERALTAATDRAERNRT